MLDNITNKDFGESKAVHSPIDWDIKLSLIHISEPTRPERIGDGGVVL